MILRYSSGFGAISCYLASATGWKLSSFVVQVPKLVTNVLEAAVADRLHVAL
jgi:hypothetical protein